MNQFSIDFFNFPPSSQIDRHRQSTWELTLIILGKGIRTIGNITEEIREGEIILIPPGIPHQWVFDPEYHDDNGNIQHIAVIFSQHAMEALCVLVPSLQSDVNKLRSLVDAKKYEGNVVSQLRAIMEKMIHMSKEEQIPALVRLIRLCSRTDSTVHAGAYVRNPHQNMKLEKIRVFLTCNYNRRIRLDETARILGLNRTSLCTFIKKMTGLTFSEYVNKIKIEKACYLLTTTSESVSTIAYDCGFASVNYFNRIFLRLMSMTPSQYRLLR